MRSSTTLLVILPLAVHGARVQRHADYESAATNSQPEPAATSSAESVIDHSHLVDTLYDIPASDPAIIRDALKECDSDMGCVGITLESEGGDHRYDETVVTHLYRHTFLDGRNYTSDDKSRTTFDGTVVIDDGFDHECTADEEEEGLCLPSGPRGKNKVIGDDTHITAYSAKPYVFHRGRITVGQVMQVQEDIAIEQAKDYCTTHLAPDCIAFTFPVWSRTDLVAVDNVTFFSSVSGFEKARIRGGVDEWRSYISTDPQKSKHVQGNALNDIGMAMDRGWDNWDKAERARLVGTCCNKKTIRGGFPSTEAVAMADTLPRVPCNLTRQEFYEQYEVPRKPVMLTGCANDWPASTEWTYDKLANRFSNSSSWRSRIGNGPETYYVDVEWREIAEAMRNNERFYLFDQLEEGEAQSIEDDYEIPDPIKGADLYQEMKSRGHFFAGPLRWFCVGKLGSGTQPHNDPYASDAWNTIVKGHKWWTIYPEEVHRERLLEFVKCDPSCSAEDPLLREWAAAIGVNAARTEYYPGKFAQHILQRPGETLYVPDGRVHSVVNLDSTIAITANYGTAANLEAVWAAACQNDYEKAKIMYTLVLNADQRKRVRQTRNWPMEVACRFSDAKRFGKENVPRRTLVNKLYDEDWSPKIGDTVEVRYNGDTNQYYRGVVTRASDGKYNVEYADGDTDTNLRRKAVSRFHIFMTGELVDVMDNDADEWVLAVIRQPHFDPDTFEVLVLGRSEIELAQISEIRRFDWSFRPGNRVMAKFEDDESQWYPASVTADKGNNSFSVRYDDGDFAASVPRDDMIFVWASQAFAQP